MGDPTLTKVTVQISLRASDGLGVQTGFDTKRGASPRDVLIDAIYELSRLAALYERAGDAAVAAARDASRNVADVLEIHVTPVQGGEGRG